MNRLVLLALCVAVAAADVHDRHIAYVPGKEYVYSYETITTTAFTTTVNQIAALKVKADVRMIINGQQVVTVKFEDPVVCKLNEEVATTVERVETVLETRCTELTGEEHELIVTELVKPFTFMWEAGLVTELRVPEEEPYWSVNIKRGLLNILNLNLREQDVLPTVPEQLLPIVHPNQQSTLKPLFRAYEHDMVGECETTYAVKDEIDTVAPTWTLTKVRNYDNCKTLPKYRTGLFTAPQVGKQITPLKTLSHADYELAGNRHHFLVQKAMLNTHFSFLPFGVKTGETAYTYIIQKLLLKNVLETPAAVMHTAAQMTVVPALKMYIPKEVIHNVLDIPTNELPLMVNKVADLLTELVQLVTPVVAETVPEKMADLLHILERLPLREFKTIITTHCLNVPHTDSVALKKREILLDVLPTLPRNDVVELLKYCLEYHVISAPRLSIMLTMTATTAKPCVKLFDDLMLLVEDRLVVDSPMLKKAVLLSSGILANKIKNMYVETDTDKLVYRPELHRIAQKLLLKLQECTTQEEKLVILSVIGNAGMLELVPELEKLIIDIETPVHIKTKAIFALKKMVPLIPKKIQQLLAPIFMDIKVPVQIRVASFLMTMKTKPDTGVLSLISHTVKTETNVEVLSFVHSYLKTLVHKECAVEKECIQTIINAKMILQEIQNIHTGVMTSKFIKIDQLLDKYSILGTEYNIALLNSGKSPVPETIIQHFVTSVLGFKVDLAEFGIHMHGLKNILWNLVGPVNKFEDFINGNIEIEEIMKPFTELLHRIITVTEPIKNKFTTTDREVPELLLNVYFKMFGYEMINTNLKEQDLTVLIREVIPMLPKIIRDLRTSYDLHLVKTLAVVDNSLVVPTPSGLPLVLRADAIGMVGVRGNVRLEGFEALVEIVRTLRFDNLPILKVITDLQTSSILTTTGSMRVGLPFLQVMNKIKVELKHTLPVKSEITIDMPEKKFNVLIEPIKQTTEVWKLEILPMTSIKMVYKTFRPDHCGYTMQSVPVLSLPPVHKTFDYLDTTVLPFVTRVEYPAVFSIFKPVTWFLCPIKIEQTWAGSARLPTHYQFEVKYFGNIPFPLRSYRTASRDIAALKFDPIREEPGMLKDSKKEVLVSMKTVGGPIQKEMEMKLCYIPGESLLKHVLNFQMISTPIIPIMTTPLKLVINNLLVLPEYLIKPVEMTTMTEPVYRMEVMYGLTDVVEPFTTLEVFMARKTSTLGTDSALYPMHNIKYFTITPSVTMHPVNILTGLYKTSLITSVPELLPTARPLVLTTKVDYKNEMVPLWLRNYEQTVKYLIYVLPGLVDKDVYVNVLPAENEANKIIIQKVLDPVLKKIFVDINMPSEKIELRGVSLPLPFMFTESRISPVVETLKNKLIHGDVPTGECLMTKENVIRTNDLMSIPLPDNQCEVVLTKDCSDLNLFMVTAKKDVATGKKVMKIHVLDKVVEIIPTGREFIVKVDNERHTVVQGTPYVLKDPTTREVLVKVMLSGDILIVKSSKLGLTVVHDRHSVVIRTSPMYRGQLCGLCGDYSGELLREMRGPDMTLFEHRLPFIASYSIPSDVCVRETILDSVQDTHVPREITYPVCEKIFRNVMIERTMEGVKNLCFSVEPVSHCSRHCEASVVHHQTKNFHCQPAELPATQTLLQKLSKRPFYLESNTETVEVTDFVSEPETCRPRV